jgi:virginiamycin B lyase
MTVDGELIAEFDLQPNSYPRGIATGPDGNLWFSEFNADRIGQITTEGVITEFCLPPNSMPAVPRTGPDGQLWFTEYSGRIGRLDLEK